MPLEQLDLSDGVVTVVMESSAGIVMRDGRVTRLITGHGRVEVRLPKPAARIHVPARFDARPRGRRPRSRAKARAPTRGEDPPPEPDDLARFWAKVEITDPSGCWVWSAGTNSSGYGKFSYRGCAFGAHRFAYETLVGPIPDDLQIDHLCRNRRCVNPAHMEPCTQQVNMIRGEGASALNARKTHCRAGHLLAGDNLYIRPEGYRVCRECRRHTDRLRREGLTVIPRERFLLEPRPLARCGVSGERYSAYPFVQAWVEAIRDHPDLGLEDYALARVSARFMDASGHMEIDDVTLEAAFDLELAELLERAP